MFDSNDADGPKSALADSATSRCPGNIVFSIENPGLVKQNGDLSESVIRRCGWMRCWIWSCALVLENEPPFSQMLGNIESGGKTFVCKSGKGGLTRVAGGKLEKSTCLLNLLHRIRHSHSRRTLSDLYTRSHLLRLAARLKCCIVRFKSTIFFLNSKYNPNA